MNYLWSVVQQLSQMLEENKAATQGVLNGVQAIQQRAAGEGNGEIGGMFLCTVCVYDVTTFGSGNGLE